MVTRRKKTWCPPTEYRKQNTRGERKQKEKKEPKEKKFAVRSFQQNCPRQTPKPTRVQQIHKTRRVGHSNGGTPKTERHTMILLYKKKKKKKQGNKKRSQPQRQLSIILVEEHFARTLVVLWALRFLLQPPRRSLSFSPLLLLRRIAEHPQNKQNRNHQQKTPSTSLLDDPPNFLHVPGGTYRRGLPGDVSC